MQIRYSPYNSPFIPANAPPGIHWIGLEHQNVPHCAHVLAYYRAVDAGTVELHQLRDRRVIRAAGRFFLSGVDWLGQVRTFWVSEAQLRDLGVAVLVTPPLSPMGGNSRSKAITKCTPFGVCS